MYMNYCMTAVCRDQWETEPKTWARLLHASTLLVFFNLQQIKRSSFNIAVAQMIPPARPNLLLLKLLDECLLEGSATRNSNWDFLYMQKKSDINPYVILCHWLISFELLDFETLGFDMGHNLAVL